jgi:hypothetical protein
MAAINSNINKEAPERVLRRAPPSISPLCPSSPSGIFILDLTFLHTTAVILALMHHDNW